MQLVPAIIAHARTRPRRNAFRYGACYFAIPLSQWRRGRSAALLSIDANNVFSLRSADYGDGRTPPSQWIRDILSSRDFQDADGEVVLLTLPRLFGYAFNPVSFWFCLDRQGRLRAVLAEVNNTFGERHCYMCFHDDHRAIEADAWLEMRKVFHVSPFLETKGCYRFRFAFEPDRIGVVVNLYDDEEIILATSMSGPRQALTTASLLRALLVYPLQTLKVVALIHYQAVKLYLTGVEHHAKPAPPEISISH